MSENFSKAEVAELVQAASEMGVNLVVQDMSPETPLETLGEVVLWRSSSLGATPERERVMKEILKSHFLINRCLAVFPEATSKRFQQEHLSSLTKKVNSIETWVFDSSADLYQAIATGKLRYPFIEKPDRGSKGKDVRLIRAPEEITPFTNANGKVYQNFIRNTGDYRVFILGGKVLGVMKRTAQKGSHLNNVSQGAAVNLVTDPVLLKELHHIGATVASIFELTLCGVDVIYDEDQKKFFFLEVNTVPQWRGFQEATGINVAQEFIRYCQRLTKRAIVPLPQLIEEEYAAGVSFLPFEKKFHFLSRLFLWTKDEKYRFLLESLKKEYLGASAEETRALLTEIFSAPWKRGEKMIAKEIRAPYFAAYPELDPALRLLFRCLFAQTIYSVDLRPIKSLRASGAARELRVSTR